ncbi:MAG TPA: SPFH domain-containing protein [Blastocatellia bacterium]|nr:SPFH domain-containing protein [Blastocatellia bacterium]
MQIFGLTGWEVVALGLAGLAVLFVLALIIYASMYQKAGPNEVLIISGRGQTKLKHGDEEKLGFRLVQGGGTIVWPIIEKVDRMSLEMITLDIKTPEFYTKFGVPIQVDGVAQIKVKGDEISIRTAAEQFLSKDVEEIQTIVYQMMSGHLRGMLGTLSVEEILAGHEAFAQRVAEVSASDLANMGLTVVSFTIREIHDSRGYLESLGKTRIAQVRRDAAIGEAEANRDATIRSAQATQEGETAKLQAEMKIAEARRDYELKQAEIAGVVNQRKAEADLAYDLQKYKTAQSLKKEEVQIEIVSKEQQILVQDREVQRRQRELEATVQKEVDAERYRLQALAEAEKYRLEAEAKGTAEAQRQKGFAEAEVIKATGQAEAEVIEKKGLAEAEVMRIKADAWKQYGQAAIAQMFIERLPELARAVSEPLSRTDKIVMISNGGDGAGAGASKLTADITKIISQLPPIIESLTGIDLEQMLSNGVKGGSLSPAAKDAVVTVKPDGNNS